MANAPLEQFDKPKHKETCKAHRHMTPDEYALWDVCMGLSFTARVLYFDGRKLAARFKGVNEKFFYPKLKALIAAGWFEPLDKKQKRTRGGTYSARQYKVLKHEEWVARYGAHECFKASTVPSTANGESSTVRSNGGLPFAESASTVRSNGGLPFAPERHSLVVKPCPLALSLPVCADATKSPFSPTGQETTRVSDGVYPAVLPTANGLHTIPSYAEYDHSERKWTARRGLGRGTTAAEIAEIQRLNRERIKPPSIQ